MKPPLTLFIKASAPSEPSKPPHPPQVGSTDKKGKFAMTLVASSKKFSIPYGVCELNSEGELKNIKEKIKNNYLVNVGLYVLDPIILKLIPANQYYDITDLIRDIKKQGLNIGVYPIHENEWTDVGQWDEYKKALEKF